MDNYDDILKRLNELIGYGDFNEVNMPLGENMYYSDIYSNVDNIDISVLNSTESLSELGVNTCIKLNINNMPIYIELFDKIYIMDNTYIIILIDNSRTIIDLTKFSSYNIKIVLEPYENQIIEINLKN